VPEGCIADAVIGTSWHGVLEHDDFRRTLLAWVARARGRTFEAGGVPFAAVRARRLDVLGDMVADQLDTAQLTELITRGVRAGLPTIETEVRACSAS
jgi:adenosylcobyric acid synthase